ncbi:hypothetical protein LTR16_012159, partial [Cryomyces antarcticus]
RCAKQHYTYRWASHHRCRCCRCPVRFILYCRLRCTAISETRFYRCHGSYVWCCQRRRSPSRRCFHRQRFLEVV